MNKTRFCSQGARLLEVGSEACRPRVIGQAAQCEGPGQLPGGERAREEWGLSGSQCEARLPVSLISALPAFPVATCLAIITARLSLSVGRNPEHLPCSIQCPSTGGGEGGGPTRRKGTCKKPEVGSNTFSGLPVVQDGSTRSR